MVQPDSMRIYYWPDSIPRRETLENYVAVFQELGFVECELPDFSPDEEKVAIFALNGRFTHVCRQLSNGRWTSKMGSEVDVEHELEAVSGGSYGNLHMTLRKLR